MTEDQERAALIREALTWLGTPFRWECCIKGVGCDCGRFLAAVANNAGIRNIDINSLPRMSPQWFLHKSDESYISVIKQFAGEWCASCGRRVDIPIGVIQCPACGAEFLRAPKILPRLGDIVVVEVGKDWGHSAFVVDWPKIIGAATQHCVTIWNDINTSPQYMNRRKRFFTCW